MVLIFVIVLIEVAVEVFGIAEITVGRAVIFDHAATQRRVGHVAILGFARRFGNDVSVTGGYHAASTPRPGRALLERRCYTLKLIGGVVETKRQDDLMRERFVLGDGIAG